MERVHTPTTQGSRALVSLGKQPGKNAARPAGRWRIIRDLAVFQVKLAADGLRDLLLGPVSFFAGFLALIGGERAQDIFYGLLRWGHRTDRFINLFGDRRPPLGKESSSGEGTDDQEEPANTIDAYVGKIERLIEDQHRRGGITGAAKAAVDKCLDAIQAKSRTRGE